MKLISSLLPIAAMAGLQFATKGSVNPATTSQLAMSFLESGDDPKFQRSASAPVKARTPSELAAGSRAATAIQNETNRINVANQFNASQNALNNLWQKYRDNAAWNFQKTESYMQRQHEVGIMAMEFANTKELYNDQQKNDLALGIGNWVATWMAGSNPARTER